MLCLCLLCVCVVVVVAGKYEKLGAVIHPADNELPTYGEGRQYKPTAAGQGSWSGANTPLGQFGWIAHPPIDAINLTGHDNVHALQCDQTKADACRTEYDHCLLHDGRPHDLHMTCHCSEIYFSQCLFAAGCATDKMHECYDHLKKFNCSDTTLCGRGICESFVLH